MTSWNVSEVSGVNLGQSKSLAKGFGKLVAWIADSLEKRRTVAMMQSLDARMLADIGVERYEIESLVYGTKAETGEGWSLKSVVTAFAHWARRRQAVRELSRLPDYMLADIGIERAMIGELVDKHFSVADSHDRTIAASVTERGAATQDRHIKSDQTLSRIDPALLADAGYRHGRMGWQPERQAATANANKANANKKDKAAA